MVDWIKEYFQDWRIKLSRNKELLKAEQQLKDLGF